MNISDGGGANQDFDLNLAPIIDCFTVLITFMLASASFLAIGIFDSGIAAAGATANDAKPPSIRLDVELGAKNVILVKVEGKAKLSKQLPAKNGDWDYAALVAEIVDLKKKWPDTKGLVLSAADDIEYLEIIRTMDALKPHMPAILLGGL